MKSYRNPTFVKSFLNKEDAPQSRLKEIAFVGRSNVGKSSLINNLLNRKNFARVSKQPGKTRTINFYLIDDQFHLVDLPGYGYAKISRKERESWKKAIEGYLLNREQLVNLFVLVDCKVGPKESDLQMLEWLEYVEIPFTVIATKADKVPRTKRQHQARIIRNELKLADPDQLILYSTMEPLGKEEVLGRIKGLTA